MQIRESYPLIVVAGPTGSGKSALALEIARQVQGEIVNCDSLQLYRGFDIGTAKTPPHERALIRHHLFDVLSPEQGYSAGEYAISAREVIGEIAARGGLPIVTGGTGFYLRALLEGLPGLPARNDSLRERLMARETSRPGSLHRILLRLDSAAADRIHGRDLQKTLRALEIRLLLRKPRPTRLESRALTGYSVLKLGLEPDRAILRERLETRTRTMFEAGLIEEVQALLGQGASGGEKPFESLGYKQSMQYLRGDATREQAILSTIIETRQYAKRQLTWFRRDPEMRWLRGFGDESHIVNQALQAVESAALLRY